MKKVFKTSLIAASVAMAFSANAAQIISTPLNVSEEGVEAGVTALTSFTDFVFDVKVDANHPSGTQIVLDFSEGLDLTGVNGAGCLAPVAGVTACTDVQFDVGNGNFTFDNVVVDAVAGTITYNVQLGNPIDVNSSFRVAIQNATIKGDITLGYEATLAGDLVDSASQKLTKLVPQFSFAVANPLDGIITRDVARDTFVKPAATTDTLKLTVRNRDDLLLAATAVDADVVLKGNFEDGNGPVGQWVAASWTSATAAINTTEDTLSYTGVTAADLFPTAPAADDHDIVFTYASGLMSDSNFTLTADLNISGIADPKRYVTDIDAGEWRIDASTVNVPYLPVGYGLTANVEIANQGNSDAEISVEAIDNKGVKYGPVVLPMVAGKSTVTKVSEDSLMAAFGITDKRKLSVTFFLDANPADITLAPYYKEGESRINVITDQYKK